MRCENKPLPGRPEQPEVYHTKLFHDDDELEYMRMIQDQVYRFFPRFSASISSQSVYRREQGRCAMVDFRSQGAAITTFTSSKELRRTLLDVSPPPYNETRLPRRRLFILEDLPRNHVLILGSRLRIPPSFFAGHWDDPASSTFNHRNPLQRTTLPCFRLRYATSYRVEVESSPRSKTSRTTLYAFDTNVFRYLHTYDKGGPLYDEPRSHHTMSFWSSTVREDGGWDAVLLVDPPPQGHVRCLATGELLSLKTIADEDSSMPHHYLYPELALQQELPKDTAKWVLHDTKAQYSSMFDDILQGYCSDGLTSSGTKAPYVVVEIPRMLVISTLISYLRRRYLNLLDMQKTQLGPHALRSHYLSYTTLSSWSTDFFDFIVGTCACMKEFSREMDENMIALGLDRSRSAAPAWEADGWKSIRDYTRAVKGIANSLAANYSQYVTIQEAHDSNMTAKNLSRITVLTMLFVPLSTVASIFSMGGDFLPGERQAWVFWIVAIPVLLVLANVYWFGRLFVCLKRSGEHMLSIPKSRRHRSSTMYP